jgi:hypothetical protein
VQWLELNNFKIIEIEAEDVKKLSIDFIKSEYGIII